MPNDPSLPQFDALWDYANPSQTEQAFRDLLPRAEKSGDFSYLAQLLTQIARAQGLQGQFDSAHTTLDRVETMLSGEMKLARVRYFLERGRVFNSSGQAPRAIPLFKQAWELAAAEKLSRYAIDAVHMIAIAEPEPDEQIHWNLKGLEMAEADASQRGWLWSLYNNIAESYAAKKDYASALIYTHKLLAYQFERQKEHDIYTLKDGARFLRLLGRPNESLPIIRPIFASHKDDGWICEELAETLHALGRTAEAKPHFVKAHEILSKDDWCIRHDPARLARLREMAST